MEKENKKYLSTLEWILSISGIVLLTILIVLPPVFRVVFKEKDNKEIVDELEVKTLMCTKYHYYAENAYNNDSIRISYYKDKVRTYNVRQEKKYSAIENYDDFKQKAGLLSNAYDQVDGISFRVNTIDADLQVITTEECDLTVFKSTIVTLPDNNEDYKINAIYTSKDSVSEIRADLENDGYICR